MIFRSPDLSRRPPRPHRLRRPPPPHLLRLHKASHTLPLRPRPHPPVPSRILLLPTLPPPRQPLRRQGRRHLCQLHLPRRFHHHQHPDLNQRHRRGLPLQLRRQAHLPRLLHLPEVRPAAHPRIHPPIAGEWAWPFEEDGEDGPRKSDAQSSDGLGMGGGSGNLRIEREEEYY